jgi:hypothetical protein
VKTKANTCLSCGDEGRSAGLTPANGVDGHDIELVFRERRERTHDIEECRDSADFTQHLVCILGFVLNHKIYDILGADIVRPRQTH